MLLCNFTFYQFAVQQAAVIKLKNGDNGFTLAHNAHSSLGHCHRLRFNIGKVKAFPEVFIYETLGQIYGRDSDI